MKIIFMNKPGAILKETPLTPPPDCNLWDTECWWGVFFWWGSKFLMLFLYLWTERHRCCRCSISERMPPSCDQSSEPHLGDGNSTKTACKNKHQKKCSWTTKVPSELPEGLKSRKSYKRHPFKHNNCVSVICLPASSYKEVNLNTGECDLVTWSQSVRSSLKKIFTYLKACTRFRSENSWRSTKAFRICR